jgi:NAD(P)-dependent dehydrogenase (short-subunit alcohol dehydrogenase family)
MTAPGRVEGVALVTGGTGALGRAVVAELLEGGAEVVTTWVVEREREAVERALGDHNGLHLVWADLLAEGGPEGAVAAATEVGEVRALVNLVGGFAAGERLGEDDPGTLERMLALNLSTALGASRAALPALVEAGGGAIVCVGARAALQPFSGGAAYAISKAAVLELVRVLDVEYRDDGVRANAVVPSVIDTPANREASPDAEYDRWVKPEQIARVIRFLCSPDSAPISGAEIPVYGRA